MVSFIQVFPLLPAASLVLGIILDFLATRGRPSSPAPGEPCDNRNSPPPLARKRGGTPLPEIDDRPPKKNKFPKTKTGRPETHRRRYPRYKGPQRERKGPIRPACIGISLRSVILLEEFLKYGLAKNTCDICRRKAGNHLSDVDNVGAKSYDILNKYKKLPNISEFKASHEAFWAAQDAIKTVLDNSWPPNQSPGLVNKGWYHQMWMLFCRWYSIDDYTRGRSIHNFLKRQRAFLWYAIMVPKMILAFKKREDPAKYQYKWTKTTPNEMRNMQNAFRSIEREVESESRHDWSTHLAEDRKSKRDKVRDVVEELLSGVTSGDDRDDQEIRANLREDAEEMMRAAEIRKESVTGGHEPPKSPDQSDRMDVFEDEEEVSPAEFGGMDIFEDEGEANTRREIRAAIQRMLQPVRWRSRVRAASLPLDGPGLTKETRKEIEKTIDKLVYDFASYPVMKKKQTHARKLRPRSASPTESPSTSTSGSSTSPSFLPMKIEIMGACPCKEVVKSRKPRWLQLMARPPGFMEKCYAGGFHHDLKIQTLHWVYQKMDPALVEALNEVVTDDETGYICHKDPWDVFLKRWERMDKTRLI